VHVLFLGTGTSHGVPMIGCDCGVCRSTDPRDTRFRTSVYLTLDDDTRVLIDTTPDLRSQALTFGVRRVDAVLLTHAHADHIMGLDEIRRFNVLNGGRAMPIYGRADTLDAVRTIFGYAFDPAARRGGGVPVLDLMPVDGPFRIGATAFDTVPIQHGPWPIVGFRADRFAYLTDCSAIPDASWSRLAGLDVLVLDALRRSPHPTHFTLEAAVAAAERIGARQTYFTHMAHELGHAETSRVLPAAMALAYDGLRVDLG
jgi:phosphoribosyl 1,2-cyclic phosphate phosphodiesterase